MCTFDSEIERLLDEGIITKQTAQAASFQHNTPPKKPARRRTKNTSRKST